MKIGPRESFDPFEWQVKERRLNGHLPKRGIFASPRLGKTLCVADTLRERANEHWKRALVTASLKVCPVWEQTLKSVGVPVLPLHELSVREIEQLLRYGSAPWEGVAIINRDKLINTWLLFGDKIDAFVADESHNYAAVSSRRSKAYRALALRTPWARALTGTPVPKHYGSLWSQLSPFDMERWDPIELRRQNSRLGSYGRFAAKFLVTNPQFPSQVIAHTNVPELQQMVLDVAAVYRREDVFGKDNYQIVRRDVTMPEKAWKLYHRMARENVLEEFNLEAQNAGVKLLRLQQITSGIIPSNVEGAEGLETVHTAKIDQLVEDLGDVFASGEKAVVFHRFVPEGQETVARMLIEYPKVPVFVVNGSEHVKSSEHYRRTEAFNTTEGAAVIVVQIQSGSEGISLRKGNHLFYLSRTFSFTDDEQSRDRAYEPGELRTITYYEVPGTVDDFVADLLANRRTLHNAIRNMDRESMAYGPIRNRRRKIA